VDAYRTGERISFRDTAARSSGLWERSGVRIAPDVDASAPISMRVQEAYVADAFHYVVNVSNLRVTVLDDRTLVVSK
jgi:hypothetical protein